jgi:predicted ATP-grasp superfamily ATP-dependent carboligase
MKKPTITGSLLAGSGIRAAVSGLPSVIVLNLFHSGLGIVRQLAGKGVRVLGLSSDPHIFGNFTRMCEVRSAPNSQEQPEQLAEFLLRIASEWQNAIIFPTRDADMLFLDQFRGALEPLYRLAIPPKDVLLRVLDKAALFQSAVGAGIAVPRTAVARDAGQLRSGSEVVGFPCVVKPVRSIDWRHENHWEMVGGRKAFRVDNLAELQREYELISKAHPKILLQEWIPGDTDQIVVWGGYVGMGSRPLAYFTARKIVQAPSEFGTGCVIESAPIPELLEPSTRLCRALGYEGIAEIEFKWDSRDGSVKLIEINARHWDWHQLGDASGVNLSRVAYRHLSGEVVEPVMPTYRPATWIAEDTLLLHALAGMCRGEFGPIKAWQRSSSGPRMYSIFSERDPVPFFRYATTLLPVLARRAATRIRSVVTRQQRECPQPQSPRESVPSAKLAMTNSNAQPMTGSTK